MTIASPSSMQSRRRGWIGPAIVALAAAAMFVWTWQTWIDVLVDFGVQLYVPWQLANGAVLYRDIAHYTGPLSIYYNALAFRVFGVSLRTLVVANLPILAGIIILVYYLMLRLAGHLCATVCGVTLVTLFAFARLTPTGNYNYVCPYEYEYTHATFLCLLTVLFLWRFLQKQRILWCILAGFTTGMIFLTRSEFFTAIIAASGMTLLLAIPSRKSWRSFITAWSAFLLAALVPAVISVVLLSLAMPVHQAIHGTFGMWPAVLKGNVARQEFYRHSMGIDHAFNSLEQMGIWLGVYLLLIVFFAFCSKLTPKRDVPQHTIAGPSAGFLNYLPIAPKQDIPQYAIPAALVGIFIAGGAFESIPTASWISMFRPLPGIVVLVLVISIFLRRMQTNPERRNLFALAAILCVMSLVLLGKILLYARIIQYGWTLAMPATMILVACLFGWIPRWLENRGGSRWSFIGGMLGIWTVVLAIHLAFTAGSMKRLTMTIGQGPDQFWTDARRGVYVDRAVKIAQQLPPDQTLDCFPEGIMINYLSRRRVSTPFVNFNPPDLLLFGQNNMIDALQKSPPDVVMIVQKDTSEFGVPLFGRDYGNGIYTWIIENYKDIGPYLYVDLGASPRGEAFGIGVMARKH